MINQLIIFNKIHLRVYAVKEERFGLVNLPAREGALERNKRPARLLPLQLL